jgi:UDP-glucose 4-epimerase
MILVTGGAGYVGSHFLRRYLQSSGTEEVVVVDNLQESHKESLADTGRIHFCLQDIGNYEAMLKIFRQFGVDQVVHFAASAYVGESEESPEKYFDNNVVNSLNLFKAMQACGIKQIVFSSSCATYGAPQKVPIDESHPQKPISVYGLTKLIVEQVIEAYSRTRGWRYATLRYFNAAGADESGAIGESHDPETHLIPLALQAALDSSKKLTVFGSDYDTRDGTCVRDYIHVTDLADAHIKALELLSRGFSCGAINLGTSHGASVKEVIETCEAVTGRKINVDYGPRRAGDPPTLTADASLALETLAFEPQCDLMKIIQTAWNWETRRRF